MNFLLRLIMAPFLVLIVWCTIVIWHLYMWKCAKRRLHDFSGISPYGVPIAAGPQCLSGADTEQEFFGDMVWVEIERNPLQFEGAVNHLEMGYHSKTLKWRFTRRMLVKYYRLLASAPSNDPRLTEYFKTVSELFGALEPKGVRNPSLIRAIFSSGSSKNEAGKAEYEGDRALTEWRLSEFVGNTFDERNLHKLEQHLDEGGDIEGADFYGQTFLLHAVNNRQPRVIEMLLLRGADIERVDSLGHTPLIRAIQKNYSDIAHLLLRFNPELEAREKVLHRTPLLVSAYSGDFEIFSTLLEKGSDPNAVDRLGMTPLILAVTMGRTEMVERLLDPGVDLDRQDIAGNTALIEALVRKNQRIAKLLTDSGANPEIRNKKGVSGMDPVESFERSG